MRSCAANPPRINYVTKITIKHTARPKYMTTTHTHRDLAFRSCRVPYFSNTILSKYPMPSSIAISISPSPCLAPCIANVRQQRRDTHKNHQTYQQNAISAQTPSPPHMFDARLPQHRRRDGGGSRAQHTTNKAKVQHNIFNLARNSHELVHRCWVFSVSPPGWGWGLDLTPAHYSWCGCVRVYSFVCVCVCVCACKIEGMRRITTEHVDVEFVVHYFQNLL